jgi:hypothetical protein
LCSISTVSFNDQPLAFAMYIQLQIFLFPILKYRSAWQNWYFCCILSSSVCLFIQFGISSIPHIGIFKLTPARFRLRIHHKDIFIFSMLQKNENCWYYKNSIVVLPDYLGRFCKNSLIKKSVRYVGKPFIISLLLTT